MKTLIIFTMLLVYTAISLAVVAQTTAIHVKYEGGQARSEHGLMVKLDAGWYEFVEDKGIYTYIMFEKKKYRIMMKDARVRSRKVKRYTNHYNV